MLVDDPLNSDSALICLEATPFHSDSVSPRITILYYSVLQQVC